jgi:hypothetical protein
MREVTDRRGWTLGALALVLGLLALAAAPTVAAANVAPQCQTGINSQVLRTGKPSTVQVFCSDPDGDALTLAAVGAPSQGTLGPVSGGTVLYTPDAGQFGADSFTYRASDGTANSAAATVNVTITRAPACQDVGESVTVGSSASCR